MRNNKATIIASGGMDSATLAYYYQEKGFETHLVGFNFGQRHSKKLLSLELLAKSLASSWQVVDLKHLKTHLIDPLLSEAPELVYGPDAKEIKTETPLPNRNMIMLAIAGGIAVGNGSRILATAVHADEHQFFPDYRPDFIEYVDNALIAGNQGRATFGFHLDTPFAFSTKSDVVKVGAALQVPYQITWSCDKNGKAHCGQCPNCLRRIEAFIDAEVADPTVYKKGVKTVSKEIVQIS